MPSRSFRSSVTSLVVTCLVTCVLPLGAASAFAAQTNVGSYEFDAGQTLSWTGDWDLDAELTFVEGDVESVTLIQGAALFSVLSLPNTIALDEARDIYLDAFLGELDQYVTIDRGAYGAISYSLDQITVEGFEFGVFTLFRSGAGAAPTYAYIFSAEVSAFASQFASAQESFALDGADLFDGVDGQGLQAQLVADASGQPDEEEVGEGEGDESEIGNAESNGSDDGGVDGLKGGANESTTDDEAGNDPNRNGSYLSPQHDIELVWAESWQLDPEANGAGTSDTATGTDVIGLVPVDGGAILSATFLEAGDITVGDLVDVWQSDDFVADAAISGEAEVLLADSTIDAGSMVLLDYLEDGTQIVSIREARSYDQTIVVLQLTTTADGLSTVLGLAQDEVTLDGGRVLDLFEVEEIIDQFAS